ncbi:MAG TPA: phosphoserine phosphatase SerB [Polyangiales bacterium]|jgi:phosphoserine phosphatase|nr:phosphoserine phosphatase SerB [Polyangiales bacterium]
MSGYTIAPKASHVIITVSGPDRPGITARLTGILADMGTVLLDIEQNVVRGHLSLGMLIGIHEDRGALKELLFAAKELEVALDFYPVADVLATAPKRLPRYVVTAIGKSLGAVEIHALSKVLAEYHANIAKIFRLSHGDLRSIEVHVELAESQNPGPLKEALLRLGMNSAFDIALQREGIFRRSKRLVVMDMDSTLISVEFIDELARAHGVLEQVAAVTEQAMAGEMDYDESLKRRMALLEGLDVSVMKRIAAEVPLTDGAERLIRALRRLGYRTAVISGGFSIAADMLKTQLGIDYAYSNTPEIKNGKLTGRVLGDIVNASRKAQLLDTIAQSEGILLDQVIAVGDGANDLLMLEKAGLGIAFRAKLKLRAAADTSISAGGLDSILYLLGLNAHEVEEVLASADLP